MEKLADKGNGKASQKQTIFLRQKIELLAIAGDSSDDLDILPYL